jgi:hypothetical protein
LQIDYDFARMAGHEVTNIGESQFVGLLDNICALQTKIGLTEVKDKTLKSLLVLIDQMPTKQKKVAKHSVTSVIELLACPLVKFLEVCILYICIYSQTCFKVSYHSSQKTMYRCTLKIMYNANLTSSAWAKLTASRLTHWEVCPSTSPLTNTSSKQQVSCELSRYFTRRTMCSI